MTENPNLRAISPEIVAQTIAAIRLQSPRLAARFHQDPRCMALLYTVQWWSSAPDGLAGLAREVLRTCPESIGSAALDQVKAARPGAEHRAAVNKALRGMPAGAREALLGEVEPWFRADMHFREAYYDADALEEELLRRLDAMTATELQQVCAKALPAELPGYLASLCSEPKAALWEEELWYLREPVEALFKVMLGHAAAELSRLADTSVRQTIFEGLDYAWKKREPVWIDGPPRQGKSASLRAYCAAHPGRARYLPVPYSESDNDLFRAVAKALGIGYVANTPAWHLREAISYILDHAGLMLLFDEAQFLYPAKPSGRSPSRLNWLRTEVVDRGLPCVLCTTPQSYSYAERRFSKATSYPMAQWLGRWIYRVELPESPSQEDLLAIARHYFPRLPGADLAELDGRAEVRREDVRQALGEMLPSALCTPVAEVAQPLGEAPAAAPRTPRRLARNSSFNPPVRREKQHSRISPASLVSA